MEPNESEELKAFRRTVKGFLERECVPHRERWERAGRVDVEAFRKAAQAGLLLVSTPEAYGGGGGSFAHEAVIIEELSRAGVDGFGISLHNAIIAPYILHHGTEAQRRSWLPRLASGELVGAVAMTEPCAGSDLQGIRTTARRTDSGYVIDGQKTFVTNGQNANLVIVVCKTDPAAGAKGISLLCVETENARGFSRGRNLEKIGQHAQDTSELFFEEVHVSHDALLGGEPGLGFTQLMRELPQERMIIAVGAQATMERALAETTRYVKERQAFGRTLFDFQNTQFKLAECATDVAVGRVFVDHCVALLIEGKLDATTAAKAKLWLSEREGKLLDECLQLFGGYGYMAEYPIARMWTDARIHRIYGGANEIMKLLIARSL